MLCAVHRWSLILPDSIRHVQPRLPFVPPDYRPLVLRLVHCAVPLLLRVRTRPWLTAGIRRVEVEGAETLAELYEKFQSGHIRLMIAFRHVEVDDPLCGLHMLSRILPRVARDQGIRLQTPLHVHFVYERGMALWAGKWLNWLFSKMGGIPVRRGRKPDWTSLRTSREVLVNGAMPLAIAPEGATNGHSERLGPLEPGSAQMAFWCVEDLVKANRPEAVFILPVGIKYHYIDPPWDNLDALLTELEHDCGLPPLSPSPDSSPDSSPESSCNDPMGLYYPRLLRLGEHLLTVMEGFYSRFYHQSFPPQAETDAADRNQTLAARLEALFDRALGVAESYFGLSPQGNLVDRCRRLEEASWSYIYRDDVTDRDALPPLERGLADWVAQEASLRSLHMRLVESVVGITGTYVRDKPTIERFAETALLMFDITARLRGDKLPKRPRLGDRWVQMTIGEPISVRDRWDDYKASRRTAVDRLTQDMKQALEAML